MYFSKHFFLWQACKNRCHRCISANLVVSFVCLEFHIAFCFKGLTKIKPARSISTDNDQCNPASASRGFYASHHHPGPDQRRTCGRWSRRSGGRVSGSWPREGVAHLIFCKEKKHPLTRKVWTFQLLFESPIILVSKCFFRIGFCAWSFNKSVAESICTSHPSGLRQCRRSNASPAALGAFAPQKSYSTIPCPKMMTRLLVLNQPVVVHGMGRSKQKEHSKRAMRYQSRLMAIPTPY